MVSPSRMEVSTWAYVPMRFVRAMAGPPQPKSGKDPVRDARRALLGDLARFQDPCAWRSGVQAASTALAYGALVVAMYAALRISVWLTLVLALPAAGLVVRLFIIQHDCGHGSYFRSRLANGIVGRLCSVVTFTPFANWRRQHAGHHAVWNNLDQRHGGTDIYSTCLTVEEYRALSKSRRWLYRTTRHPIVTHLLLPPLVFLFLYRIPFDTPPSWVKERRGVLLTNVALSAIFTGLVLVQGWKSVLIVQVSIMFFASIAGVWLFSVQHRFEGVEWMRQTEWTALRASLSGSSYLQLPRVLQWFTGNIGFHHVHHLLPRIPNYRLQACHEALLARAVPFRALTLGEALRAPYFALWDEAQGRMVALYQRSHKMAPYPDGRR